MLRKLNVIKIRYVVISIIIIVVMVLLVKHLRYYYLIRPEQMMVLLFIFCVHVFLFLVFIKSKKWFLYTFFSSALFSSLVILQLIYFDDIESLYLHFIVLLTSWLFHGGLMIPVALFLVDRFFGASDSS